ncbi:decaprenyl-phosphate phosphoribosyltransferase [Kribbella sp. VKM Ac-2527]|uniref:Decaprenyl-phosphate phosphoribosyltransferase n=1 Tax=Kribbella caucasensis TaxID=2512215 RepID=A0A4R6KLU3_9ACTN|nr:decaprenyl-phosphate phosphoribosyltransferase [Kribbella sp. VKM Ac-2527]TDO51766.1 decaprenyl-phosphate phosphoribosyltransferase [Kribbella sp. VKM Ac-2527]
MTNLRNSSAVVLRTSRAASLLRLSRPQQWHKAVMLFAAPVAAGVIDQPHALLRATVAAAAFILLSVGIYAFNDVRDAPDDRRHPRKQHRPVASGAVSPMVALVWGCAGVVAGLTIAGSLGIPTFLIGFGYLAVQFAYVFGLKHIAVVDVVAVALGFVLRAAAGGTATGVAVSNWFLLVSLFGALFLVAGKRRAERSSTTSDARSRPVLAAYSASWLDQLTTVALLGTVLSYGLWAFQYLGDDVIRQLLTVSFLPFLTGLLRYGLLVSTGRGELPEHEIFRDRVLLLAGLLWAVLVGAGLYLA